MSSNGFKYNHSRSKPLSVWSGWSYMFYSAVTFLLCECLLCTSVRVTGTERMRKGTQERGRGKVWRGEEVKLGVIQIYNRQIEEMRSKAISVNNCSSSSGGGQTFTEKCHFYRAMTVFTPRSVGNPTTHSKASSSSEAERNKSHFRDILIITVSI